MVPVAVAEGSDCTWVGRVASAAAGYLASMHSAGFLGGAKPGGSGTAL